MWVTPSLKRDLLSRPSILLAITILRQEFTSEQIAVVCGLAAIFIIHLRRWEYLLVSRWQAILLMLAEVVVLWAAAVTRASQFSPLPLRKLLRYLFIDIISIRRVAFPLSLVDIKVFFVLLWYCLTGHLPRLPTHLVWPWRQLRVRVLRVRRLFSIASLLVILPLLVDVFVSRSEIQL